ncbi:hypothetical protein ADILRU_0451 [Leifsonia rubra CMS 76R]|nr:hypothetical protein ADILRU_0451 [Leifsonia rubra CMS 76R]
MPVSQPHPEAPRVAVLPAVDRADEPWRNGGGSTRQIAALSGQDGPAWCLSMARVETDGPFSVFPGVTRTIMVMDGGEMVLKVAGAEVRLGSEPFTFDGEAMTHGSLLGSAVTDFNVMVRRGLFTASTERIAAGRRVFGTAVQSPGAPRIFIVVAPPSGARIELAQLGLDLELAAYDAVMIEGVTAPLQGTVTSPGSSVQVVLTPRVVPLEKHRGRDNRESRERGPRTMPSHAMEAADFTWIGLSPASVTP